MDNTCILMRQEALETESGHARTFYHKPLCAQVACSAVNSFIRTQIFVISIEKFVR